MSFFKGILGIKWSKFKGKLSRVVPVNNSGQKKGPSLVNGPLCNILLFFFFAVFFRKNDVGYNTEDKCTGNGSDFYSAELYYHSTYSGNKDY